MLNFCINLELVLNSFNVNMVLGRVNAYVYYSYLNINISSQEIPRTHISTCMHVGKCPLLPMGAD